MHVINDYRWQNKVILVVEDDNINYQYMEALLKATGIEIIHAKTGEEAVNLCQTIDKIDLVLMDIQLPFMSGHKATQIIKSFRKDLPIIAQTAYVLNDDRNKSLEAEYSHYISKPIDPEELYSIISKCINR
jgi:CheY-like chemotaxis protein